MLLTEEISRIEVDRILQSDTFRASDALRRLFRFLAEKAIAGEADQLKEYTIGLDAFGKPSSYDPRNDAIVRLQAGRLRLKLAEYYRTEGKDDAVIITLPKGHFKLSWEPRSAAPVPIAVATNIGETQFRRDDWRRLALLTAVALLASIGWATYTTLALRSSNERQIASSMWTPELRQIWGPFIGTDRSLVVAFDDPLFVGFVGLDGNVVAQLRLNGKNRWEDAANTPGALALRKAMGNLEMGPRFNFAPRGDLDSAFRLGKLLGSVQPHLSVGRVSQISWQSLSENNVLLVGSKGALDEKMLGLPMKPELMLVPEGVRNLRPRSGEPQVYRDGQPATFDGEVFALVSAIPGPFGITRVGSFVSNRFWGNTGAIESFTDPVFARTLVEKLRGASGQLPQYYQVVLKVKYRDGVATDVSYVTHRDLSAAVSIAAAKHP